MIPCEVQDALTSLFIVAYHEKNSKGLHMLTVGTGCKSTCTGTTTSRRQLKGSVLKLRSYVSCRLIRIGPSLWIIYQQDSLKN